MKLTKQEFEIQCQTCKWWLRRGGDSNTCFPRAFTYVVSPLNKTAMPAHKSTFDNCPFREVNKHEKNSP